MILGVGLARRLKPGSLLLVDGGRVLVYASLALGLVVGTTAMTFMNGAGNTLVLYSLCGVAVIMLVATVLTPFREQVPFERQIAQGASEENGSADSGKCLSSAACVVKKDNSPVGDGAIVTTTPKSAAPKKATLPDPKRAETPWRRTCQGIADLYKLSPRETEIFFLIAKGRNAEFVQQKLVISMHTAKTHIANIYHKLGVHSSQEMLSLIETFREEDIKSQSQG